jgi:hypothetical protein
VIASTRPVIKAIFYHSSQVGSGATESTCHCLVQHQDQSQNSHLHLVQPSGSTSTETNIMQTVVQVTDLPSTVHIEVVQPSGFTSTSNTIERQTKHIHTRMGKTQLTQNQPHLSSCRCGGEQWFNHQGLHPLHTQVSIHIHARM